MTVHKIRFVVTYGNAGLEVEFFDSQGAYLLAVDKADEAHERDEIDSYTCDEFTCTGCGREELACSVAPCADVIADREA